MPLVVFILSRFDLVASLLAFLSFKVLIVFFRGLLALILEFNPLLAAVTIAYCGIAADGLLQVLSAYMHTYGRLDERFSSALGVSLPAVLSACVAILVAAIPLAIFGAPSVALRYIVVPALSYSFVCLVGMALLVPVALSITVTCVEWSKLQFHKVTARLKGHSGDGHGSDCARKDDS